LLDDPLSAVDPKVAKEIFEKYIRKFLKDKNKTIILATHGMQASLYPFLLGGNYLHS
jgi:ABC-type multidrug transport system ATPase subunit